MTRYAYETDIQVRFRDLDTMGHVNNTIYATYVEQARAAYFRDVLELDLSGVSTVIAHLEIDFVRSIELDQSVTVAVRVPSLGESSIPMEYEVRVDGEVAATASTVQVAFDRESESPRPLPESWRERIRTFEGLGTES